MTQTADSRSFNPHEHLIQLKSKAGSQDYLPVQWRLVWFREQCPEGTIETEEVQVDLDREVEVEAYAWNNNTRKSEKVMKRARGYARFRAVVTDGKGGRATGTKSENAANFPDYIEKAETGAIGRALAALGYGTQFAPELDEEHRIVDAPVDRQEEERTSVRTQQVARPPEPAQKSTQPIEKIAIESMDMANAPINSNQLTAVKNLCTELGRNVPTDIQTLTHLKAKSFISQLTAEVQSARQAKANNRRSA